MTDYDDLKPETKRILAEIKRVPYGQVSAYRDIGYRAGLINGARQVARALHGLSRKYELPWWRIIRADQRIGLTGEGRVEQIRLLRLEGVEVSDVGKVLSPPLWFPKGVHTQEIDDIDLI